MAKVTMPKKRLTVGELRTLMKDVPDSMPVYISVAFEAVDMWGNEYWDTTAGYADAAEVGENLFLGGERYD